MPQTALEVHPLTPARRADFLDFFEHRAFTDHPAWASCYCHFPHADHRAVPWNERSAEDNRAATCARIDDGRMSGWLAYDGATVVGWCNAGPRREIGGLFDEPEPLADRIGAIVCFVVAPDRRGHGIAAALLKAACAGLEERGFSWAEAYPRAQTKGNADDAAANHYGPLAMYLKAGFDACGPVGEHAVKVRKSLGER